MLEVFLFLYGKKKSNNIDCNKSVSWNDLGLTFEDFPQLHPYGSGKDLKEKQSYFRSLLKEGEIGKLLLRKLYTSYIFNILSHLMFILTLWDLYCTFLLPKDERKQDQKLWAGTGVELGFWKQVSITPVQSQGEKWGRVLVPCGIIEVGQCVCRI